VFSENHLETELQRHQASQAGTACGQSEARSEDDSARWLETLDEGEVQIDHEPTAASDGNQPYEMENRSPLPTTNIPQSKQTSDMQFIIEIVDYDPQLQGPFSGWRVEVTVKERESIVHSM
jgi:hypothetical protein